jgi:hypothetical protein
MVVAEAASWPREPTKPASRGTMQDSGATRSSFKPTWSPCKPTWSPCKPTWSPSKSTWSRSKPTWSHFKPTWSSSKPTWSSSKPTWSYSKPTWSHSKRTWSHSKRTWSHSKPTWSNSGMTTRDLEQTFDGFSRLPFPGSAQNSGRGERASTATDSGQLQQQQRGSGGSDADLHGQLLGAAALRGAVRDDRCKSARSASLLLLLLTVPPRVPRFRDEPISRPVLPP